MKFSGKQILAHLGKLHIIRNASNRMDCFTLWESTLGEIKYQLNYRSPWKSYWKEIPVDFCGQPLHGCFLPS